MPAATQTVSSIRQARISARRYYAPSPMQRVFTAEAGNPTNSPLARRFGLEPRNFVALQPPPILAGSIQVSGQSAPFPNVLGGALRVYQDDDGLIPEPGGEAGRPSRNGYVLKNELQWEKRVYQSFLVSRVQL